MSVRALKIFALGIIFFGNLAVIIASWIHTSGQLLTSGDSAFVLIALGRIVGLIAEFLILVQLVLMGRIRQVEQEFGLDKLNRLHRWIGYTWGGLILFHPLFLTIGYAESGNVSLVSQFVDFFTNWQDVWKAVVGLLIMYTAIIISISIIKRKIRYETWYFTHILIYIAIFLFFQHQVHTAESTNRDFYYYWYVLNFTIFGLVLLYRFIRPLYLSFAHAFTIEKVVKENDTIVSVYIIGKKLSHFSFQAGQYAHITFLARGMWYTHPFSFSAAPHGKFLRLSIKNVGDFTSQILKLKPGTRVIIDGPFGVFTEKKAVTDKYLFIAGGIGITPVYAMIESLSPQKKDMVLLYGNRSKKDAVFLHDLAEKHVTVHSILSLEPSPGHEFGYIDKEKINRLVPDIHLRDVYLCGPVPMMKGVLKTLKDIGVAKKQIHFERFGY
jgi:predicted ferric reductase